MGNSFNWFDALTRMESYSEDDKVGSDYNEDAAGLAARSESWVTCAVGNLCSRILRDEHGCPMDNKLEELGLVFMQMVGERRWTDAIFTLNKIEKRSQQILDKL